MSLFSLPWLNMTLMFSFVRLLLLFQSNVLAESSYTMLDAFPDGDSEKRTNISMHWEGSSRLIGSIWLWKSDLRRCITPMSFKSRYRHHRRVRRVALNPNQLIQTKTSTRTVCRRRLTSRGVMVPSKPSRNAEKVSSLHSVAKPGWRHLRSCHAVTSAESHYFSTRAPKEVLFRCNGWMEAWRRTR